MIKRLLYFLAFIFTFNAINAQQTLNVSVYSEVSILTIGPGDNLYDAFGHSAIRIKDPLLKIDWVFNYGVFDFNQPNFYSNFAKGRLLYKLGVQKFDGFLANYRRQKRWIKEQILNLSQKEKQAFFNVLYENAKPSNADYLYDPFFDNCASKLRDITHTVLTDDFQLDTTYTSSDTSLRKLMNKELPWNTWGSFGINMALGSVIDRETNASEYLYLPDYIYLAFKNGIKKDESLVKKEISLLEFEERTISAGLLSPFNVILLVSLIITFFTFKDYKRKKRSKWIDFLLFFTTGLVGILITFLWFFTDHKITPNNFNALWAFAPNLVVAFLLFKNKTSKWISYYLKGVLVLLFLLLVIWILEIQLFNFTVLPLLIVLIVRYFILDKYLLTFKK